MSIQPALSEVLHNRLHALLENYSIDYATFLTIHLYADRGLVERVLAEDGRHRNTVALDLMNLRDEVLSRGDKNKGFVLVCLGVIRMLGTVTSLAECLAAWAYTDSTVGGALQSIKTVPILRSDGSLTPKVRRRLYSPKWILRYVRSNEELLWTKFVSSRLYRLVDTYRVAEDICVSAELLNIDIDSYHLRAFESRINIPAPPTRSNERKRQRKVLRRSYELARSVLPNESVRRVMAGGSVILPGAQIDLSISSQKSLFSSGHGSCAVRVLSKAGEPLADLCVYFEDTPVLDQVVGFALHMSSGSEQELLCSANLTRVHPAGARHKLIRPLLKSWDSRYHERRLRELEYIGDTKQQWESACLDHVFGASRSAALQRTFLAGRAQRAALSDGLPALP